jgi:hypothetical protein
VRAFVGGGFFFFFRSTATPAKTPARRKHCPPHEANGLDKSRATSLLQSYWFSKGMLFNGGGAGTDAR